MNESAGHASVTPSKAASELAFGLDAPLVEVMRTVRAMRRLKSDPVPRELLTQLVEAATWAPSGSNAQANSWVVVTGRDLMRQLAPLYGQCYEVYSATFGAQSPPSMDADQAARWRQAADYLTDHFAEVPALFVACYDLRNQRRALRGRWRPAGSAIAGIGLRRGALAVTSSQRAGAMTEAASVYPAVQNLLLTARALGLGATLTTLHLLLESEFKRVLNIPSGVRTFAAIPVGWPLGHFGPVSRRPASEAIHWDHWRETGASPQRSGGLAGTTMAGQRGTT